MTEENQTVSEQSASLPKIGTLPSGYESPCLLLTARSSFLLYSFSLCSSCTSFPRSLSNPPCFSPLLSFSYAYCPSSFSSLPCLAQFMSLKAMQFTCFVQRMRKIVWNSRYNEIVLFLVGFVTADDKRKYHVAHRQKKSKYFKQSTK
jgi:hypothetical protein